MAVLIEGQSFDSRPEWIDGRHYLRCTFKNTPLVYAGGELPSFESCTLDGVGFQFDGPAGRTLEMMRVLNSLGAPFVQAAFDFIRSPHPNVTGNKHARDE
ncbi:hypothetical protein GCM10007320_08990 [Pseudorhodoferax aquiterrae]|uniref:Uncharacterized protein n=1 Tax=Pseudorhodoferax aquiterrae TaxID=747304 RepID=A0ABQ3FXT1_9BURK|nr:hypothetical protein GCM10007320_08990 [Pseudorhodoferax aquiterrae]